MVLLIPTGVDAEENDTVYLYLGRSGRAWRCIRYWRRCGRLPHCRLRSGRVWGCISLLETML